jgi:UDP-2,4-diacetamido-2,4,6-trideoxy-beta-L-altropyranose hydrolase
MTSILFRCDGSPEIGLGHIVRCLALADELRDIHNCRISFAMRKGPLGIRMVEEKGYNVITVRDTDHTFNYGTWLNECVREVGAQMIVFDVRDGLRRPVVKELRDNGILIVTIDDPEDKRLEADMAFYPPVPQIKRIDWTGFKGELYVGWEWVILRKEFSEWRKKQDGISQSPMTNDVSAIKILVTMGGSDPQGMTLKAVKALEMLDDDFEATVVLGAGFQHKKQLNNLLSACKHCFDVRENVQNMAELMAQSDLAVASFGVTAYELAAMGVPAIYLCLTEDHAESASAFVEEGMAISLGAFTHVTTEMIATRISNVINNKSLLSELANNARKYIDGQGVARMSRLMVERFETENG